MSNLFQIGQEVYLYSDDNFICKGIVKESSPYDVLVEGAAIPIGYVGMDVEVRNASNFGASAFGIALAFGPNCIDENDLITVAMVTDRDLSRKRAPAPPISEEQLDLLIESVKSSDMATIPGMDKLLVEAEKLLKNSPKDS